MLSGANNRLVVELGVVKAFLDFGLRFDLYVGSSAGSILAAWLGAGEAKLSVLEALVRRGVGFFDLFAPNWELLYRLVWADGIVTNEPLRRLVARALPAPTLDRFATPTLITATDLTSGATVVFDRGPAADAVAASTALPVLVRPRDGLVDGGLGDDVPVDLAVQAGAAVVYAVEAGYGSGMVDAPHGLVRIAEQAWSILAARKTALDLQAAGSRTVLKVFEPRVAFDVPPWQYAGLGQYIDQAYAWTMEQLRAGRQAGAGTAWIRPESGGSRDRLHPDPG